MDYFNIKKYPSDEFRTPENIALPDIRNENFGDAGVRQFHKAIANFQLGSHVPKDLIIQFDTSRNLFLYAFHVYRFFPIAQHQLYITLERAIRECVGSDILDEYRKNKNKNQPKGAKRYSRGLKLNLTFIVEKSLIKNEDFRLWHEGKARRAEDEYHIYVSKKMSSENLSSYKLNEAEIDYDNVVYNYNYLEVLCECLPSLRNSMAHGAPYLHGGAVYDYEIVSVIINRIFERHRVNDN